MAKTRRRKFRQAKNWASTDKAISGCSHGVEKSRTNHEVS